MHRVENDRCKFGVIDGMPLDWSPTWVSVGRSSSYSFWRVEIKLWRNDEQKETATCITKGKTYLLWMTNLSQSISAWNAAQEKVPSRWHVCQFLVKTVHKNTQVAIGIRGFRQIESLSFISVSVHRNRSTVQANHTSSSTRDDENEIKNQAFVFRLFFFWLDQEQNEIKLRTTTIIKLRRCISFRCGIGSYIFSLFIFSSTFVSSISVADETDEDGSVTVCVYDT